MSSQDCLSKRNKKRSCFLTVVFVSLLTSLDFGKVIFHSETQPHPSQHQSYPCKRSDTCCYPSRHSYGIWLSDVPRGPHDLNVFWNYTVGLNKCAYLLATLHLDISFRSVMIDMQRQFKTN